MAAAVQQVTGGTAVQQVARRGDDHLRSRHAPRTVWGRRAGAAGLACLALVALLCAPAGDGARSAVGGRWLAGTLLVLGGQAHATPPADLLQDLVGARALLRGAAPYPDLGPAITRLGAHWPLPRGTYSTHPPTAFLFLLPLAGAAPDVAAALWAWLMLAALALSALCYGVRPRALPLLLPVLLWPPALLALQQGQLVPLWVLGLALAWRWRTRPVLAGAAIGLASLVKLTPAIALLPFLRRRQWGALWGFGAVWTAALGLVVALDRGALPAYLVANHLMAPRTVARGDNGALLPEAARLAGLPGLLLGLGLLVAVLGLALRTGPAGARGATPDAGAAVTQWSRWEWLAVATLPICWTYSLLPLLPGLLRAVLGRNTPKHTRGLGVLALALPYLGGVPWSSAPALVLTLGCASLVTLQRRGAPLAVLDDPHGQALQVGLRAGPDVQGPRVQAPYFHGQGV